MILRRWIFEFNFCSYASMSLPCSRIFPRGVNLLFIVNAVWFIVNAVWFIVNAVWFIFIVNAA